jgi:hypothetical protein
MNEQASKYWTDQEIRNLFLDEVNERFEAENRAHRKETEEDEIRARAYSPHEYDELAARGIVGIVSDSPLWELYKATQIIFDNGVRIILPPTEYADGVPIARTPSFIRMFENTEAAWSGLWIEAELVDDIPRIVLSLCLVDSWDDARSSAWRKDLQKSTDWLDEILREVAESRARGLPG